MTIVVYRNGVMASDSGAWDRDVLVTRTHTKIFRIQRQGVGDALFGAAGEDRDVQALLHWVRCGELKSDRPKTAEVSAILARADGEVLVFEDNQPSFVDTADWTVIGSGREFMYGVLAAGVDAVRAVEIGIERLPFACGPVCWHKL